MNEALVKFDNFIKFYEKDSNEINNEYESEKRKVINNNLISMKINFEAIPINEE